MMVNGMERKKVTAADFEMETTQPDRVLLPYRGELWGDLLYRTLEAALPSFGDDCERGLLYDEAIRETDVSILFNIQRRQIRATACVTARTTRGEQVMMHMKTPMEPSELLEVLDCFFMAKRGAGLAPIYRINYMEKYIKWRSGAA